MAMRSGLGAVRLAKPSSNLFRKREAGQERKLDVRGFCHVLTVDPERLICETEGMITYEDLVSTTLRFGLLPTVVPELKSITIGGALTGIGIESSSFRYGLVHESIEEFDVLLPDGSIVRCNASNKHRDLFFAFPNSYGTLGYVLSLKVGLVRAAPYVRLDHRRFDDQHEFLVAMEQACEENRKPGPGSCDFVDGTVFSPTQMVLTTGTFVEEAPYTSDYTYMRIYYRSLLERQTDYLSAHDYIWRWDTDWFWCSRRLGMQNPLLRLLAGRKRLRSTFYWKILMWTRTYRVLDKLDAILRPGWTFESVVQDVEIPIGHSGEFLDFFHREVGITPIWVCPTRALHEGHRYDLYSMDTRRLYLNFGFWDVVPIRGKHEDGLINRKVELEVRRLAGRKSLYSTSFYPEKEFWALYNGKRYADLKRKYDPDARLKNLYEKTVRRK